MAHFRIGRPEYYEQRPAWLRRKDARDNALFALGSDEDRTAPVVVILELAPGARIERHGHACERFEIVVAGSLETEDGAVLQPGDVMRARANELYGPIIAGPQGCTTAEYFSDASGVHQLLFEQDGEVRVFRVLEGDAVPFPEPQKPGGV
jgi:hypothetical protein